jgi:hypothetical protein
MRKSTFFLIYLGINFVFMAILSVHAYTRIEAGKDMLRENQSLVRYLNLTDLCLFTESRYTRNVSMADVFSPFQDGPLSFDHFPSGTMMQPPPHLKRYDMD